jgi:predicted dehydrogenase/putative sterol carrier protein
MDKINVGFIGCGRISDLHVLAYRNNRRARLLAVCDTDPGLLAARKKEWKAPRAYADYRELLADPDIDAVEIITPHKLHEQMVEAAVGARKHISLQKPMTTSLASADRMVARAKEGGVVFKVNDIYVCYPPIAAAKKMIDDGVIGDPQMLRFRMIGSPHGGWKVDAPSYDWRYEEFAEGRLSETFDHGHHEWAVAWYLLGEVERVSAWIDSLDGIVDSPVSAMWKYRQGVRYGVGEFTHAADLLIPSKYYSNDESFEVTGSRGIIQVHRCTGNIRPGPALSLFNSKGWRHFPKVKSDWADGFIASAENFFSAVRGEQQPLLSGDEGREVLRLAFAVQKSARTRREVFLEELDRPFGRIYAWARRRRQKKESFLVANKPSFFGERLSKYAVQAGPLTEKLAERFKPSGETGWKSVAGIRITADGGAPEQLFTIRIDGNRAAVEKGRLDPKAKVTLIVPAGTWAAVLLGKKRLESALFTGKLKVEGEPHEGLKIKNAFGL